MYTPYYSQYCANALTLSGPKDSVDALSRYIANARVDLNPHQIDAALFALRSPFANGAILADEVGLGKTIEAGLVLSQKWAERKRRILLVVPAMLRKQWEQELRDKFFIPSIVIDTPITKELQKRGHANPFDMPDQAVICSYHYAASQESFLRQMTWDMVVFDEAHRMKNIYQSWQKVKKKPDTKKSMVHRIVDAVGETPKMLLTATPLQNSLIELFSLVSIIDERVFGDLASFKQQFVGKVDEAHRNSELKKRLALVCSRTLRKQVVEYVPFTNRTAITQEFFPNDDEQQLYDEISAYLQRQYLYALPTGQRHLITLVLRKLLASSTFAVARTLQSLVKRLQTLKDKSEQAPDELLTDEDIEGIERLVDEYAECEDEMTETTSSVSIAKELKAEFDELSRYAQKAANIKINAKGETLLTALTTAFAKAKELGALEKAVIFTESRETQTYLFGLLSKSGYEGKIVTINGDNKTPHHTNIYQKWKKKHEGTDRISGSRDADIKMALVDYFRDEATLLIATEAAAEGVNLQFCSIIVNFDLPWNPQRVEQRIGRCHRYGQKHDVVVVNFINRRNAADRRVYELLDEKFKLFNGVFGASDEILGSLESGIDIERRIAIVYQRCRTNDEIQTAFEELRNELDEKITAKMKSTRQALLEHFDEEVRARLKLSRDTALEKLSSRERWLLDMTRFELGEKVYFDVTKTRFRYPLSEPIWYNFDWKEAEESDDHFYRADHPLAKRLIQQAKERILPISHVIFDYSNHPTKIGALEPLIGKSGWLRLVKLTIKSAQTDEHLVFAARTDDKTSLDDEICRKLLSLSGKIGETLSCSEDLDVLESQAVAAVLTESDARNARFFEEEVEKLDRWSQDLKNSLEIEIKEIDKDIDETKKSATLAGSLKEKIDLQRLVRDLEQKRNKMRKELYESQDTIDQNRDKLIGDIEKQLEQTHSVEPLFSIRWTLE